MSCEYYFAKLGNAITIGLGDDNEIAKIWFDVEGESKSPLTQKEAEKVAQGLIEFFEEHYPVTPEVAEKFGDSDEALKVIEFMNKLKNGDSSDFLKALILAKALGG